MSDLGLAKERLGRALQEQLRAAPGRRGLFRLAVPSPAVDLPRWLAANPGTPRFYWSERGGGFEWAGIGVADALVQDADGGTPAPLTQVAARLAPDAGDLRYFGGLSFDGRTAADPDWAPFGAARFTLPRFEITREGESWSLACTIVADPEATPRQTQRRFEEELAHLRTGRKANAPLPPLLLRTDSPDQAVWVQVVEDALRRIEHGPLQKVVLARRTDFRFAEAPDPFLLLHRLRAANPEGFHFAFQPEEGSTFLGVSPERLYRREGRHIISEAVAGTRRRGDSEHEDQAMGAALLESEKDRREHRFVADEVGRKLDGLCRSYRADREVSLLKLARLQHLRRSFEGTLRSGVDDAAIVAALHPTPAVAGNPTAAAVAEIAKREPFHRGWYAGPLGWVGSRGADFTVAIRSGLLSGNRLALFTGAGIVRGSMPHAEWEELENKLAGFVRAIGAP
ncbi:MAG: isochorismate synthase [Candidatus Methylomirabilia bacterium]